MQKKEPTNEVTTEISNKLTDETTAEESHLFNRERMEDCLDKAIALTRLISIKTIKENVHCEPELVSNYFLTVADLLYEVKSLNAERK